MSISMSEIAEKVGVSTVTVSRALRGVGRMRPETREAIRSAAKTMGYPLDHGVLKRTSRSRGTSEFQPRLLMPLFRVLRKEYFQPALSRSHQEFRKAIQERLERNQGKVEEPMFEDIEEALEVCRRQRITGLLIRQPLPHSWMRQLASMAPIVMAGPYENHSSLTLDVVSVDEPRSAAKIVDYLYTLGHREIAWFGVLDKGGITDRIANAIDPLLVSDRLLTTSGFSLRYAAWASLAKCQGPQQNLPMLLPERDWRHQSLREVMWNGLEELLAMRPQPTAVVVASSYMANELKVLCKERRIKVPKDISIVSYGRDYSLPQGTWTEVVPPYGLVGQTAVDLLERRLAMPDAPPVTMLVGAELKIGRSTGPVPVSR